MKGYETIEEGKTGRKNGKEGPCLTISDFPLQRYCNSFAVTLQKVCRTLQWEVTDGQNSNGILASRLLKIVYNPRAHFLGTVFVATFYLNLRCTYIRIE